MNDFDGALTKSLDDFMESYKITDTEKIYSNGTEFVPIFRVKQWEEYNNKDKEIERLNNIIAKNKYSVDELNEIERLNNIINELEKWLNEKICLNKNDKDYINGMTFVGVNLQMYQMFLDKLQELKGSDKE